MCYRIIVSCVVGCFSWSDCCCVRQSICHNAGAGLLHLTFSRQTETHRRGVAVYCRWLVAQAWIRPPLPSPWGPQKQKCLLVTGALLCLLTLSYAQQLLYIVYHECASLLSKNADHDRAGWNMYIGRTDANFKQYFWFLQPLYPRVSDPLRRVK